MSGNRKVPGSSSRPRHTTDFKKDAAATVIDGERTITDVAKSLGLAEQTLGNWVCQERIDRGDKAGLTSDERAELVRRKPG